MRFGHLDFQNIYFLKNEVSKTTSERPNTARSDNSVASKTSKNKAMKFQIEFLFIDNNLLDIIEK